MYPFWTVGHPDGKRSVQHRLSATARRYGSRVLTAAATVAAQPAVPPVELADSSGFGWDFWPNYLYEQVLLGNNITDGRGELPPVAYVFVGTLVTFLVTRGITRFIHRRSSSGAGPGGVVKDIVIRGVHIHHQVFGILLMLLAGIVLVDVRPDAVGLAVLATTFGVGVGLAFDEFALWLHLDDVYWRQEGRKSIDAVAIVLVLNGVVAVIAGTISDFVELGPDIELLGASVAWIGVGLVALTFLPATVCLLKGKTITAGVGVAYIPLGLVGAFRLAKPESWFARTFYRASGRRAERSRERFGPRYNARWNRVRELVGGVPTD